MLSIAMIDCLDIVSAALPDPCRIEKKKNRLSQIILSSPKSKSSIYLLRHRNLDYSIL